jgi:hypothetical protein
MPVGDARQEEKGEIMVVSDCARRWDVKGRQNCDFLDKYAQLAGPWLVN